MALARFVLRELDASFDSAVYWFDLTSVLDYLHSTSKRKSIFETNHIKLIRELWTVNHWRWIDSQHNPANLYSRGGQDLNKLLKPLVRY